MNDMTIKVEGMHCASCVSRVEDALKGLPFVADPSVNLAGESANLTFTEPGHMAETAEALARAGYPVVTDEIDLSVDGLVDAAAVAKVEAALNAVPAAMLTTLVAPAAVFSGPAEAATVIVAALAALYLPGMAVFAIGWVCILAFRALIG